MSRPIAGQVSPGELKFSEQAWASVRRRVAELDPVVAEIILDALQATAESLLQAVEKGESPIEQLLCLALVFSVPMTRTRFRQVAGRSASLDFYTQVPVRVGGRTYRVDALISAKAPEHPEREFRLVIECDGHDYHERTKEQAARDRSRDRALTAAGYHVLRFTGSEIWSDPWRCRDEILTVIERLAGLTDDGGQDE